MKDGIGGNEDLSSFMMSQPEIQGIMASGSAPSGRISSRGSSAPSRSGSRPV